jgi:hypothetical protein
VKTDWFSILLEKRIGSDLLSLTESIDRSIWFSTEPLAIAKMADLLLKDFSAKIV